MKKLFVFLLLGVFMISFASAAQWDNDIRYEEEDMKVIIENIWGLPIVGSDLGSAELKSHNSVNHVLKVGFGKEEVVMYYDFKGWNTYKDGLGEVSFIDRRTNEIIQKDYEFVEWKEIINIRPSWSKVAVGISQNGTILYEEQITGTFEEKVWEWVELQNNDIRNGRIGLKIFINEGDYIDAVWEVAGKKITKHAAWTADLNTNLVAYYNFENDLEEVVNGYNGTNAGTTNTSGLIGSGRQFVSASSQSFSAADTADLNFGTGAFSLNGWVKSTEDIGTDGFITKHRESSPWTGWTFRFVGGNIGLPTIAGSGIITGTSNASDGNWNMITWVRTSGGVNKYYFNGIQEGSNVTNGVDLDYAINMKFGVVAGFGGYYGGDMDEISIYKGRDLSQDEITQLYNGGSGLTYIENPDNVVVTLNSPADNFTSSQNDITFNSTVNIEGPTGVLSITNVSLLVDGVINETNTSGVTGDYVFDKTFITGDYNWSIRAVDNQSVITDSGVRNLVVDLEAPLITIESPLGTLDYNFIGGNEVLNITFTDILLDACWYNHNGTNITINGCVSGVKNSTQFALEDGNLNMTIHANDTSGNTNSTFINWSYTYFENNRTFNNESYETQTESFNINVEGPTSASVFYNGTEYTSTKSGNNFNRTFQIPIGQLGNNSIYWEFDSTQDSYTSYQDVSGTVLALCNATYATTFLNISFKDEENLDVINASIPTSTFNYYLGDGTVFKTLTFINTSVNFNYEFCATPNETLSFNSVIQYKQGSAYPQRIYSQALSTLTNTTTDLVLYLLGVGDGLFVTFQVFGGQSNALEGVSVSGTRILEGSDQLVAQGTTDAAGTVTFWINPDFLHTMTFIKTGVETVINSIFPTQTLYTITMGSSSSTLQPDNSEGIVQSTFPGGSYLDSNTFYTFTYIVGSSVLTLTEYGFELFHNNGTSIYSGTGSTATGGTLDKSFNVSNESRITMDYYYIVNSTRINGTTYWLVYSPGDFSIYHFFNRVTTYIDADIFGILGDDEGYFAKAMLSILILILVTGTLSSRYGLASESAVTGLLFGVLFMLNIFNLIPTPDFISFINLGDFLVFIVALYAIVTIIKEEGR